MAEVTRDEHLAWCKKRAREYLDQGDIPSAIASMMSDIDKHPETKFRPGPARDALSMLGLQVAMSADPREALRYIEGFR